MELHQKRKINRESCPHCDADSFALEHPLKETTYFRIVCDVHPLEEGHILIIPKRHVSCIGEYTHEEFEEFLVLYRECFEFIRSQYGSIASFEHGKVGQTVFHSHVHLLPFSQSIHDIVPEGERRLVKIHDISDIVTMYKREHEYLFVSIGNEKWFVDTKLGTPGFFRERFAQALHNAERGNWKFMHKNHTLMRAADAEMKNCKEKWQQYSAHR